MKNTNTVMGTMEHQINVFGPQQHYDHHNSNYILLDNLNLAASAFLSAWVPLRVKGYTDLIALIALK